MLTYTQCHGCKGPLLQSFAGQRSHAGCESHPEEKLCREFCDAVQREDEAEARRLEKLLNAPKIPALPASAMWYVKTARWWIFPLRPNSKTPATKHGLKDASNNPDDIRRWWTENPNYNIGGVTGIDYDILDVDGPDGFKSLRELGPDVIPDVYGRSNTRRGQHIFLKPTGDGNRAGVRPGLDYRGASGYCLLPGSRIDGAYWTWAVPPSPEIFGKA